jgi:hypothetical protein
MDINFARKDVDYNSFSFLVRGKGIKGWNKKKKKKSTKETIYCHRGERWVGIIFCLALKSVASFENYFEHSN